MEKKNKTLLYVVGVLLVVGVGISLAYFAASIFSSGNGSVTNVKTANIGDTTIVTEGNVEFTETDVYPGHKNISKIKITATGNQEVLYHLIWKGVNTLQTSLNYTVYKSTTNENPSISCEKKIEGTNTKILYEECTSSGFGSLEELTSGSITTATEETVFQLKENETITATSDGTVVYYYVVLEFPNEPTGQNYDANGKFEGETNIQVPDAQEPPVQTFGIDDIIATLNVKSGTPDFTVVATGGEDEDNNGIYMTDDPMYGEDAQTYYWRGAATTNHVIFANKCWRIVRINGDKTTRLIYNGSVLDNNTCFGNGVNSDSIAVSSQPYNDNYDNSSYVGWTYIVGSQRPASTTDGTPSDIKTQIESWYRINIINNGFDNIVANGKFCNDRRTENNEIWRATGATQYYAARRLRLETKTPDLSCDIGDVYELKIGLIVADEIQFAGASWTTNNKAYYLYNGQYYWTMTPFMWNGDDSYNTVLYVHSNGNLAGDTSNDILGGRPVINLVSAVTFSGQGTSDNPYIVQE